MITDVGIDLDGVLYDFVGAFRKFCETKFNRTFPEATKWDFYHDWGFSDAEFSQLMDEATKQHNIFSCQPPLDKAIEGWEMLKKEGVTIHILTHRFHPAHAQTCHWLDKYGFKTNNLHFGMNKGILKKLAKDKAAAIDDQMNYYLAYKNEGIISFLHTQPWNVDQQATRVADLVEFAKRVYVYNEYRRSFPPEPVVQNISKTLISPYTNPLKITQPYKKQHTTPFNEEYFMRVRHDD